MIENGHVLIPQLSALVQERDSQQARVRKMQKIFAEEKARTRQQEFNFAHLLFNADSFTQVKSHHGYSMRYALHEHF